MGRHHQRAYKNFVFIVLETSSKHTKDYLCPTSQSLANLYENDVKLLLLEILNLIKIRNDRVYTGIILLH